ncbi:MAG: aminopeptidase P family protein [Actinobacteria bacterium]|nr:MAG: aminopeptidase P family protein [Actinomycetota bacterium]
MTWPRDDAKLERVRALMEAHELDALVVRAPDNVLYLSNYWGMKGYEVVVFPSDGDPILIALEPSRDDAERNAWTDDIRLFAGYDELDPSPPQSRVLALVQEAAGEYDRIGLELSLGTQAADRMVGEPTTYTAAWFDAWPHAADATPLLNEARAIKTEQELARMRIANEISSSAMEYAREHLALGMKESEAAAMWEGFVHSQGTAREDVELARGFSLVWSGPGIRTFTATSDRPVQENEPTLYEIWVCADGYWCDYTKNICPGKLTSEYEDLLEQLLTVYNAAIEHCRPGASLAQLDGLIRAGIAEAGYPGQPSHPVAHGVGARAHEPPYAHQAGGGTIEAGMVLAIEPGIYWEGGGGLRLEDNFLITDHGAERLGTFPDDFRTS